MRTVGDLLAYRPRDYQQAVGVSRIADLLGEDEAVIASVVQGVSAIVKRTALCT